MKKTYKIKILLIITLLILLIINNNIILKKTLFFTKIFITKLYPPIFIMYLITGLLLDFNILYYLNKFKNKGSFLYVLIMSFLSGFPSGSKYIKDLINKNLITLKDANYFIMFSHFPNPFFILNILPLIIKKDMAYKIYISLIISNIIICIIFKTKNIKNNIQIQENNMSFIESINKNALNSIKIIINIYTISLFFYIINVLINNYLKIYNELYVIVNCIFDLTTGIIKVNLINNNEIKYYIILFFFSFGNIPIHYQIKSIISDTSISYNNFLKGRTIELIISIIIFNLIKLF